MSEKKTKEMAENELTAEEEKQLEEAKRVIKFSKPYKWEGTEYTELDISGFEKMTVDDAIKAQRAVLEKHNEMTGSAMEMTTAFILEMMVRATEMPVEFFELMPKGAFRQVKLGYVAWIRPKGSYENHVITFDEPYSFKGNTYTEIDLSRIGDLNTMNEIEAESRMTRAGFGILENAYNIYYACVLASMAAALPEEFFTGLPFSEAIKLRGAANDPDFFE